MSSFSGTFNADNQAGNTIILAPGQSVSYTITTASLTGSVVFEKTTKLDKGFSIVDTMTATDSGTYKNESQEDEIVRLRCVELDDDPGSETVTWTLADVTQNSGLEYIDTDGTVKTTELSEFMRTLLDDGDAETARTTLGVPSIIDVADAQASVLNQVDFTSSEPGSPTSGDRYINTATGTSSGTSQSVTANYIYEWNGTTWDETIPTEGAICTDENSNVTLLFNGSAWINLGAYSIPNGVEALTTAEVDQLENIGSTTISAAQWGYLGGLNQALDTDATPTFDSLFINGASESQVPPIRTFNSGVNAAITSFSAVEGAMLIGYQKDSGSPYTKVSALVANGDGTVPTEFEIWTKTQGDASVSKRVKVDSKGNFGIGTDSFGSSAVGVLAIANGTQGGALADAIQIASEDLSAGNTIPSIRTEGTDIYATGTPAAATGSIAMKVNGTVYHFTVSTTAAS